MSVNAKLNVKTSSTQIFTIEVDLNSTVIETKEIIEKETGHLPSIQRLIYSGQVLANERTLESYNIKNGHTMHLVARSRPIVNSAPSTSQTTANPSLSSYTPPSTASNNFGGLGQGTGGIGDMGGGMGGGIPNFNPNMLTQLMQNPLVQQQMQQILSNPEMMQQLLSNNPMAQQMFNSNPQMAQMFQDPAFFERMSNPNTIQQMMQFQQQLGAMGGNMNDGRGILGQQTQTTTGTDTTTKPTNTKGTEAQPQQQPDLSSFLGSFQGATAPSDIAAFGIPSVNDPETRYAAQLSQLNAMGFSNKSVNIQALQQSGGNVEAAVERLLSG